MAKKLALRKIIVAYVPVIHRGYQRFFEANADAQTLYIIGSDLIRGVDYLRKDLRALDPRVAANIIRKTTGFKEVNILTKSKLKAIDSKDLEIILPDEDISHAVAAYFKKAAKLTYYPVFLRWDRQLVEDVVKPGKDELVSTKKVDQEAMHLAFTAAAGSADIWRRVGAVLLDKKDRKLGMASNQGEPSSHSPWVGGDPRNVNKRGVDIELSVFTHAEALLIAQAAKKGTRLQGAKLYVTTFPCPVCAKLIAHSGIQKLYYASGYAVLDGKQVLEHYGVKLVKVQLSHSGFEHPDSLVPYKKS